MLAVSEQTQAHDPVRMKRNETGVIRCCCSRPCLVVPRLPDRVDIRIPHREGILLLTGRKVAVTSCQLPVASCQFRVSAFVSSVPRLGFIAHSFQR